MVYILYDLNKTVQLIVAYPAFCKARKGDEEITIGYSSGSKIWSSSYYSIPDYISWCDENGKKIANSALVVKTGTNYDLLPIPKKNIKYPYNTMFCFLSESTYLSPPLIIVDGQPNEHFLFTDLDIKIVEVKDDYISIEVTVGNVSENLICDLEGRYTTEDEKLIVRDGRSQIPLVRYLTSHPLSYKTTDDTVIIGGEIFTGDKDAVVFSSEHITAVDWGSLGTDINNECAKTTKKGKSIQTVLQEILVADTSLSNIVFEHGSGEIADFVTFCDINSANIINVNMYHVKAMKGAEYNTNVNDVYEVSQQAIKSTIWIKDKNILLDKIIKRIRNSSDPNKKFVKGDLNSLKTIMRGNKKMEVTIYIVQPAISMKKGIPDKIGEVLAAAMHYVKRSGRAKELKIWGSQ